MERFWGKVRKTGSCWEWTGTMHYLGYGRFAMGRRSFYAHRISWELANGPIPRGMFALHKCDNRGCVRPDHLFLGSQRDNVRDAWAKKRAKVPDNAGERHGLAKLSEKEIKEIRTLNESGISQRELARRFNVSNGHICGIIQRKFWKHI